MIFANGIQIMNEPNAFNQNQQQHQLHGYNPFMRSTHRTTIFTLNKDIKTHFRLGTASHLDK